MASGAESIGAISISITGDASPLYATLAAAQSTAASAGSGIASALTGSLRPALSNTTGLVNQYGQAIQSSVTAPTAAAVPVVQNLSAATAQLGATNVQAAAAIQRTNAAMHGSVSEIQAVSGTLRTLEGNQGIRAAERFLTLIPGLGAALQY